MSRWKQLPDSLDPRVRQLAVRMRRIKDHSGLSLQALAARTGYSRASWDRYLNGRSLPPKEAVAALARACDMDPARLLALHEVAVAAGRGGGQERPAEPGADPGADPDSGPAGEEPAGTGREKGTRGRKALTVVLASAVLVTAVIVLLVAAPWHGGPGRGDGRPVPAQTAPSASGTGTGADKGAFVYRAGKDYPCRVHRAADGLLYAGYSTTRVGLIGKGSAQWDVVEAQCLLRHHGLSPGVADGAFGSRTERAVERLQQGAHLRVDGVVGEDTWGVLRK
ncbi:helix-turn-helix domain-containing protein [Streptomyces sp. NPDC001135]